MCQFRLSIRSGNRDYFGLRGSLYGGEPALFVGPALIRRLNFTSLLHGNFLPLLPGLDIARMLRGGPALLSVFIQKISSPSRRDLGSSLGKSCLGGLALLSCKWIQIFQGNSQEGEISAKGKRHLRTHPLLFWLKVCYRADPPARICLWIKGAFCGTFPELEYPEYFLRLFLDMFRLRNVKTGIRVTLLRAVE